MLEIVVEDDGFGLFDQECKEVVKWGCWLDEMVLGIGFGLFIVVDLVVFYGGWLMLD